MISLPKLTVCCFLLMLTFLLTSCDWFQTPQKSSAYVTQVFDYVYAPGQHAKLAMKTDAGNFIGEPTNEKNWLYLGGFGGYVVAGFDHNVLNGDGVDFELIALKGASPEPGIVYVMSDTNADGLPNETWYELKGNLLNNSKRHYWLRYYKPSADTLNIGWKDSEGNRGELKSGYTSSYNTRYTASWWWSGTKTDSITFHGTRLPDSYTNTSTTPIQNWIVPASLFNWGYVKNLYGTDYDSDLGGNKLDISNAIDSLGNAVNLPHIRFIKVQTAVFQQAGWLNEVSTEVRGAKDLRK